MEYVYAALMLHETGTEINEQNLTATVDAAGGDVDSSRIKAIVAALEDVDLAATRAATMGSAGSEVELEGSDEESGDPDGSGDRLGGLFDDEHEGEADAEGEGIASEDDSVEGAARPSDLDGEAVDSSDESEA